MADIISVSTNGAAAVNNTVGGSAALTNDIGASLSEDGKTLTLTLTTGTWEGTQKITVLPVDGVDVNNVEATQQLPSFTTSFIYSDTVRPDVKEVKVINSNTVHIITTEPISAFESTAPYVATVRYEDAALAPITLAVPDSTTVTTLAHNVNVTKHDTRDDVLVVDLSDVDVLSGKNIVITLPYLTDFATTPNIASPKTVTVQKGAADTVKPTVKTVTPVSYDAVNDVTTVDIELTEAVKYATGKVNADLVAGTTLRGVAVTSATLISQATKIRVEASGKIAGNTEVKIAADILTDVVGNTFDAYGKAHTLTLETTAPKLVSSRVAFNQATGNSSLILTFDEYVALNGAAAELAAKTSVFKWVDAYGVDQELEVTGTDLATALSLYNTDSAGLTKQIAVDLTASINGSLNGASAAPQTLPSNIDLKATIAAGTIVDLFDNDQAEIKDLAVKVGVPTTGTGAVQVDKANIDGATTPGTIIVPFTGGALNPTEAKKASNYAVEGATIKEVKLISNNDTGAVVHLVLNEATVKVSGNYEVTVKPIATLSSSTAANANTTANVALSENVLPTVANVVVTELTADTIKATLTTSEVLNATNGANVDVALFVNGKDTGERFSIGTIAAHPTLPTSVISLTWEDASTVSTINVDDLTTATSIKLVILPNNDVVDNAGNNLKVGEIVIK